MENSKMDMLLPRLTVARKVGSEPFRAGSVPLDFNLLSFWRWSASDLVSNALRGCLAEFLVAQAVGIADGVRVEWSAYDLCTTKGLKTEVKSAAYVQSWAQKSLSKISFDIKSTCSWDPETTEQAAEKRRQADLYVFALLSHSDKLTLDPMDVSQWEFFLLPRTMLDTRLPTQKWLSLSRLLKLKPVRCLFAELSETIERVGQQLQQGATGLPETQSSAL
jgi:hypothetical protein